MRFLTFYVWVAALMLISVTGCDRLSVKDNLNDAQFELVDHRGDTVTFPDDFSGKAILAGYVYTHCPDICPMITFNMRDVEQALDSEDLYFLSISFDPDRDTPEILADYVKTYQLDDSRWSMLTGDRKTISILLERLNIVTVKTPSRFTDSGNRVYFIDHTDRVTLIDKDGNIRRNYMGSELSSNEVIEDIRTLMEL